MQVARRRHGYVMEISSTDTFPLPIFPCSLSLSLSLSYRFPFFLPFFPYYTSPSPPFGPVLRLRHYFSKSGAPHVPQLLVILIWFHSAVWHRLFHYFFLKGMIAVMGAANFTTRRRHVDSGRAPRRDLDYRSSRFLALSTAFFSSLKFNGTLQLIRLCTLKLPLAEQSQFKI